MLLLPSLCATSVREGESFESWIHRFAFLRQTHPAQIFIDLGFPRFITGRGPQWKWSLGNEVIDRLAAFARVSGDELRSIEFSSLVREPFPDARSVGDVARERWVSVGTMRFCPQCLAEDAGHLWRWRLGCVIACVRHETVLQFGCPSCGLVRSSSLTRPNWLRVDVVTAERCPKCEASLALSKLQEFASEDVLRAQVSVDAALAGDAYLFGERVAVDVWVSAIESTAALSMLAATVGKGRKLDQASSAHALRNRKRNRAALLPAAPAEAVGWFSNAVEALENSEVFRSVLSRSVGRLHITARESTAAALLSPELTAIAAGCL